LNTAFEDYTMYGEIRDEQPAKYGMFR